MANSVQVREIALKTDINGDNHNKTFRDEHVTQRLEPEMPEEQAPTTVGQVVPPKNRSAALGLGLDGRCRPCGSRS